MIKQILITVGFIIGIIISAYLLTSFIELSLNITDWSNWSRVLLIGLSGIIFQIFVRIGDRSK